MKRIISFAFSLLCCATALTLFSACGGGGGGGNGGVVGKAAGLAPATVTGNITLTPKDANVHGIITLTNTPARVAYFNSNAGTTGAYTGNYTYTKVGPNMAEIKVDNLRYEPINTASDCHWTIIATITFVGDNKVVLTGTETLTGGAGEVNDPLTFGGATHDNHFDVIHDDGGTRNFSLNYEFEMAGH